ncbi:MAG: hypothetical protein K6G64_00215 [Eubacterium sp.]|nr:hypothetical protein [Eubacterium sp.]
MKQKIVSAIVSVAMISGLAFSYDVNTVKEVFAEELVTTDETEKVDLGTCIISGVEDKVYSGSEAVQNLEIKNGEKILVKDVDYTVSYENAVDVGTATMIVTGIGNYTGAVTQNFVISVKKIKAKVVLKKKNFPYKKKGKYKPGVVVKDGDLVIPASNYSVIYPKKVKKIGTYTVKVKLRGNYSGSGSAKFNVVPYNTKIKKLTGIKGGVSVLWQGLMGEKFNEISGYEVACSTSRNFKSKKTQKCSKSFRLMEVRKLKSKKLYYVKMRTFKILGKKKFVYSTWSSVKKVKTK